MNDITKTMTEDLGTKLSAVLIGGDLSRLTPEERVQYYDKTCKSLGLNPLTKPFAYIKLQGKETLYATKACTDQLRKVHSVSIVECVQQKEGDLYIVTVKAQDHSGKTDIDVGVLPIGHLKGDALSNAIMKTVTKAKRRVTLSICGLGMLDETEIETIPNAVKTVQNEAEPKRVAASYEDDFPRKDEDVLAGANYLYIKGKFRNSRNSEIDLEEMGIYFNKYLAPKYDATGSFSNPEWQETYDRMKDWLENYAVYSEIEEELNHA